MADTANPLAPHHLPWFITPPGATDALLVGTAIFLIVVVIAIGNLYFQLHALPERWAHKTSKVQIQIVAVLCLLALFTHNHIFWIAALLLALVQFPDFSTPMYSIADSLERLASRVRPAPPVIEQVEVALIEGTDKDAGRAPANDEGSGHGGTGGMTEAAGTEPTPYANDELRKD
jgi:hypothetical protein